MQLVLIEIERGKLVAENCQSGGSSPRFQELEILLPMYEEFGLLHGRIMSERMHQ